MNCTEFRKLLMQEPTSTDRSFLQHATDCGECGEEYDRALEFEARLLRAVEVDIPHDLTERVLDAAQESMKSGFRFSVSKAALVASFMWLLMLVGWMGFQWGSQTVYAENLPQVVSRHIEKERLYLQHQGRLSEASVARLFSRFGAVMHASVGEIAFAEPCWIRRQHGMHLILREASGPVTLMFMPGEHIAGIQRFVWEESNGLIVPTDYGSLAIVATTPELLDQIHQRINDALMWST